MAVKKQDYGKINHYMARYIKYKKFKTTQQQDIAGNHSIKQ